MNGAENRLDMVKERDAQSEEDACWHFIMKGNPGACFCLIDLYSNDVSSLCSSVNITDFGLSIYVVQLERIIKAVCLSLCHRP